MAILASSGQYKVRELKVAQDFCQTQLVIELSALSDDQDLTNHEIQTYLWTVPQTEPQLALQSRLSLRCWLSHQIVNACNGLAAQFGESYGFTSFELWPLVLDDDGRLEPVHQPLSLKILEGYDPKKAALSTWTHRITKSHPEVNRFLLDRGLYRVSDWAILNDTPTDRLARIFPGLSKDTLQKKEQLLEAYHRVYRSDRIAKRQQSMSIGRCSEPTPQQLIEIGAGIAPHQVLNELCELATELRHHRIAVRGGMPRTQSLDEKEAAGYYVAAEDNDSNEDESQDLFLQRYRAYFLEALDDSIKSVTLSYANKYRMRNPPKDQMFLAALQLFHCQGLSMTAIAQQLGFSSQVQVTRLLKLKSFRAEVCAHWLNQLNEQVKTEVLKHITPERLTQIADQLEKVLSEETEAVIAEASAEAQIPRNRGTNSVFARHLCAELAHLN